MTEKKQTVVGFWRGEFPTESGFYFDDILNFSYEAMESGHDYIQWVLPKREPSMFRSDIPTLKEEEIELFNTDSELKEKVNKMMHKVLDFYGMELKKDGLVVWQKPKEEGGNHNDPKWWIKHFNHNFLRITRMLISLRHLGHENVSKSVFKLLSTEKDKYDESTEWYWSEATYGPLP